jgi:hypothetical protein
LIQEILEDVVERIIHEADPDLEAKIHAGDYPTFISRELEEFLEMG